MAISFHRMTSADAEDLYQFLTTNRFPFHVNSAPTADQVLGTIEGGRFWGEDAQAYWINADDCRIGMVTLEDLKDDTPMFDLRLTESKRGQGAGVKVLRALCDLVFTSMPETIRFEGQTREDNIAMRKTFLRSGFVKEAHYRMGWQIAGGERLTSVAYAILRKDWESGTTTPVVWEETVA